MIHKSIIFLLLSSILLGYSCKNSLKRDKSLCITNSFYQNIESINSTDYISIKKFPDVFVRVEGFFTFEFENVAIYPSQRASSTKALWLNFSNEIVNNGKKLDSLNYKKVSIIGRVNTREKGHLGGYIASLDSVFCIQAID